MAATDVIKTALERNWGMVDRALEGLDDVTLAQQPNANSNSVAWLLWHMTRVVDTFVNSRLQSKPQLWVQDGWHQKFGMNDDPGQTGQGMSSEDLAAWTTPSRDVLLGYFEAVKTGARDYLTSLTDADLSGSVVVQASSSNPPTNPGPCPTYWESWSTTTWFTEGKSPTYVATTKAWGGLSNPPLKVIAGLNQELNFNFFVCETMGQLIHTNHCYNQSQIRY